MCGQLSCFQDRHVGPHAMKFDSIVSSKRWNRAKYKNKVMIYKMFSKSVHCTPELCREDCKVFSSAKSVKRRRLSVISAQVICFSCSRMLHLQMPQIFCFMLRP